MVGHPDTDPDLRRCDGCQGKQTACENDKRGQAEVGEEPAVVATLSRPAVTRTDCLGDCERHKPADQGQIDEGITAQDRST